MTTLLQIDSSARALNPNDLKHQSISRLMAQRFLQGYKQQHDEVNLIHRDLAVRPVSFIDESFLAASFHPDPQQPEVQQRLLESNRLINEVKAADLILMTAPMYNYGMPAVLKAWFDQVIRINQTFDFDLNRGDAPLAPLLSGKTLVLMTSCGEFGFYPGGANAHMDHLASHILLLARYLGAEQHHHLACEYQEFADQRHQHSKAQALKQAHTLGQQLAQFETS